MLKAFTQRQLRPHITPTLWSHVWYSLSTSSPNHTGWWMLKVGNEKRTSTASLCVIRAQEGRWVQGEAIWAFAGHQHLPWGCPPFWSSARRLRWLWSHIWRWLPFWAGLRAQQPEAGGKGVFPAEATQCSGLSLASQLGLAPARRDTQCHPE